MFRFNPSTDSEPAQADESAQAEEPQEDNAEEMDQSASRAVAGASALYALCCSTLAAESEHEAFCYVATAIACSAVAGFYGYEPETYAQACSCDDHREWHKAMAKEMAALEELNVFQYVLREAVPAACKIIKCKWVYKIKPDKYKARLVVKGFMETAFGETFSPTLKLTTLRMLFAIATLMN